MATDEQNQKMQKLLLEVETVLDVMADLAIEMGIDSLPWRDGYINFALDGERAVNPPVISDEQWRASSMHCYPSQRINRWLRGDDENDWIRGSYADDDYDFNRPDRDE